MEKKSDPKEFVYWTDVFDYMLNCLKRKKSDNGRKETQRNS